MTAGGVEDTALHYKREISVVVKKTTCLVRQKRSRTCVTFLRASPLDVGPTSTPIVPSCPLSPSRALRGRTPAALACWRIRHANQDCIDHASTDPPQESVNRGAQ